MTELRREADPRTLHFGPLGLGGPMTAEASEQFLAALMDALVFGDRVPKSVISQFEKVKALFRNSLFSYESFTHAERDAYRVLEVALKVRFLEHYQTTIPLLVDGVSQPHSISTFEDVRAAIVQKKGSLGGHPGFDASFAALLAWARMEGYFCGQHNRIRESVTPWLRNHLQHAEHDALHMPPDVSRTISLHFEWIQRLWGYFTPQGKAYPGPTRRTPWIVGRSLSAGEVTWFPLERVQVSENWKRSDGTFTVVLAANDEDPGHWREGHEQTSAPVRRLWGPGAWGELVNAAASNPEWLPDEVELLDRLFFIQIVEGAIAPARSAGHVRALRTSTKGERWYVVRADRPDLARHHVMELLGRDLQPEDDRHALDGPCSQCAAESVFSGATVETVRKAIR